jgi:hypothetical protein
MIDDREAAAILIPFLIDPVNYGPRRVLVATIENRVTVIHDILP